MVSPSPMSTSAVTGSANMSRPASAERAIWVALIALALATAMYCRALLIMVNATALATPAASIASTTIGGVANAPSSPTRTKAIAPVEIMPVSVMIDKRLLGRQPVGHPPAIDRSPDTVGHAGAHRRQYRNRDQNRFHLG